MAESLRYKRVVLKISGDGMCKPGGFGIDPDEVDAVARQAQRVAEMGVEPAMVIGGGNIVRGARLSEAGFERTVADHMGMLGTVINGLALQDALERLGAETRLQTAINMTEVAEPYIRRRALRHLEKGRIVILAAGTGSPIFTTDTCAALRATELRAEALLKATKVDGVYKADPVKHPDAERYDSLSYMDVIKNGLKVMDATAVTLCMENKLPIIVFNLKKEGNIERVIRGETVGTTIEG